VTDNRPKLEIGNSKLDTAQTVLPVSSLNRQVSDDSRQKTKLETGNSKLDTALTAPRASSFDSRVSSDKPHLTAQQLQFLLRVTPAALASERDFEIPASVTLAQAILESATPAGWGSSTHYRLANNPFGIKYSHFVPAAELPTVENVEKAKEVERGGAQGIQVEKVERVKEVEKGGAQAVQVQEVEKVKEVEQSKAPASLTSSTSSTSSTHSTPADPYGAFDATTWEIENGQKKVISAEFQRFPNLDEAFRAHALLLRSPRYRPAFAVRGDWKKFAERLGPKISPLDSEHCGYSTNPSYSAELIKLVTLYRLDDPRAVQWFATGNDPGAAVGSRQWAES